jgi:hypothetical protein
MAFTANFAAINLLVIFGAAVAAMIFGAIWYSPLIAGKKWQELSGRKPTGEGVPNAPVTFGSAFVLQVFAASMLAAIMGPAAAGGEGLQLGIFVALFIVLPALGTINLFERKPAFLLLINVGYQVGALGLMGYIIGQFN